MKPSPETEIARDVNRRTFLGRGAAGIGIAALNSLLNPRLFAAAAAAQSRGAVNPLDFAPKAKRVIFLYQAGRPSHLETFDFKPKLLDMYRFFRRTGLYVNLDAEVGHLEDETFDELTAYF
jgi:hypothetical protein